MPLQKGRRILSRALLKADVILKLIDGKLMIVE